MFKSSTYKTLKDLHQRLLQEGIVGYVSLNNFRNFWLYPREEQGRIVCLRDATRRRFRLFTQKQLDGFVECFKPGGKGSFDYHDYE